MDTEIVSPEEAISKCSWCGKAIADNTPVFGFSGKKRSGVDLSEYEGQAILVTLATQKRRVIAMVTSADSDAKKDGNDFMFMVCSEQCASQMKSVMEQEVKLGDVLFDNLKKMGN